MTIYNKLTNKQNNKRINKQIGGFTVLEVVFFIAIVGIVIGAALWYFTSSGVQSTVTGSFTTKPATVQQTPSNGTFVWQITRQVAGSPARGIPNRTTKFEVFPAAGVRIKSLNGTTINATSGTEDTDATGQVTVVLEIDYVGSARLVATDTASNQSESVSFNGVQ